MDGLDVEKLLPFFKTVFQLVDFLGMSDRTVLELVFPYCRGPMAERVADVMRRRGGVAEFHQEVLEAFVPGRLMEQLRHRHFYRVQARGESLAQFVQRIREVARILGLGMSEEEVAQNILDGVSADDRLRLVFAQRPQWFADLERRCV